MKITIGLMVLFGITALSFGEIRIWKAQTGQTIEAEYVKEVIGDIVLKTPSGKVKRIPLAVLSQADQDYVNLKHVPKVEVKVDENKEKGDRPGDIDNVTEELEFKVEVLKKSKRAYPGTLKAHLFVFGADLSHKRMLVLLDKKEETFKLTPKNRNMHYFKGKKLELEHDPEPEWGMKYKGYLVCITTSEGEVLMCKGNSLFEKQLPALMKARVGARFDRNMKQQK